MVKQAVKEKIQELIESYSIIQNPRAKGYADGLRDALKIMEEKENA